MWYPMTVLLIGQCQSFCETSLANVSPDEGMLQLVPSAPAHCIPQGAAVRSWGQKMLFLVPYFKCVSFFPPPKIVFII